MQPKTIYLDPSPDLTFLLADHIPQVVSLDFETKTLVKQIKWIAELKSGHWKQCITHRTTFGGWVEGEYQTGAIGLLYAIANIKIVNDEPIPEDFDKLLEITGLKESGYFIMLTIETQSDWDLPRIGQLLAEDLQKDSKDRMFFN